MREMDGIIVIDKPQGVTSRDVVNLVAKKFHTSKVGHTGTLDPLATGCLVIAIGQATKIIELLVDHDKTYVAEVKMGYRTDTLDISGQILEKTEVPPLDAKELTRHLEHFVGTYEQEVPLFSAARVNGKKLYQYARAGQEVTLPKRPVTIEEIKLLNLSPDSFTFSCHVSKGTYIRSLIRDIGNELKIPCVMQNLRRTNLGIFSLEDACTIDDLEQDHWKLFSIPEVLKDPVITLNEEEARQVMNGMKLPKRFSGPRGVLLDPKGTLLAIYQEDAKDPTKMRPWKVFQVQQKKLAKSEKI